MRSVRSGRDVGFWVVALSCAVIVAAVAFGFAVGWHMPEYGPLWLVVVFIATCCIVVGAIAWAVGRSRSRRRRMP